MSERAGWSGPLHVEWECMMVSAGTRRGFVRLALFGLVFTAGGLAGCSNPGPGTPASGTAAPGATGATAPKTAGKPTIAGIGFQDDQFFKLVELGMKDAAAKQGVEFSPASSAGSLEKEISLVDTFTTRHVDAICVAPMSQKASIPTLKRAHDAGVKIITFDSTIDADFPVSSIRSDQVALGRLTGDEARKYIEQKLHGKAKIAILSYVALAPEPANQRTQGLEEALKPLPGVQVVARQDAWLAPEATSVVENILTAHPDIDLIWAANEGGTVGAVTAVKSAGKAGKVVVFGTDMSDQIGGFLLAEDGILQAVTGQKPFDIGTRAVEAAVHAAKGEPVEKRVALPGALFARRQPDAVKKYQEYLRGLSH
jgi:ABC-type sugar transport system substrate-binding protein